MSCHDLEQHQPCPGTQSWAKLSGNSATTDSSVRMCLLGLPGWNVCGSNPWSLLRHHALSFPWFSKQYGKCPAIGEGAESSVPMAHGHPSTCLAYLQQQERNSKQWSEEKYSLEWKKNPTTKPSHKHEYFNSYYIFYPRLHISTDY